MYDAVVAALVRAGWPEGRALSVIVAVEAFLLGAALDAAAAPDMLDPGSRTDVPAFSGAYAARARALAAGAGTGGSVGTGRSAGAERPADEAYRVGIAAMIAGLRVEFAALTAADPGSADPVPADPVPADPAPVDPAPADQAQRDADRP